MARTLTYSLDISTTPPLTTRFSNMSRGGIFNAWLKNVNNEKGATEIEIKQIPKSEKDEDVLRWMKEMFGDDQEENASGEGEVDREENASDEGEDDREENANDEGGRGEEIANVGENGGENTVERGMVASCVAQCLLRSYVKLEKSEARTFL